jgi:transposase-like protein
MKQIPTPALARVFKRLHHPFDVMLICVRWYVAYGLSVRNLPETITIDKSGSNLAALEAINAQRDKLIKIRRTGI